MLGLFVIAFGGGLAVAIYRLIHPLRQRIEAEREALVIESLHGGLDNQIIGALQLGREVHEGSARGYAVDYVAALLEQTRGRVSDLRLPKLVDLTRTRRLLAARVAVLIVTLARSLNRSQRRDRAPAPPAGRLRTVMDTLFPVDLRVSPGDVAVVRGRPVTLSLEAAGARRHEVVLHRTELQTKKS